MPRLVCISDTHNRNKQITIPEGDILIHAGDATFRGTVDEIRRFDRWFAALPHRHKIFIAGNHDWLFETDKELARTLLDESVIYLQDSAAEIEGIKFYGSPWQPRFYDWAFNLDRGPEIAKKWEMIPDQTEVLITHGPPNGILDVVPCGEGFSHEGCEGLRERLKRLGSLRLHVFGHIHCGYGTHEENGVRFVNAAICDEAYQPINPPIVVEL